MKKIVIFGTGELAQRIFFYLKNSEDEIVAFSANKSNIDSDELLGLPVVALDDAEIKYSTVQNWYPGDKDGKGGIYNFVTKRGKCKGKNSKISWTQVETGLFLWM